MRDQTGGGKGMGSDWGPDRSRDQMRGRGGVLSGTPSPYLVPHPFFWYPIHVSGTHPPNWYPHPL